MNELIMLCLLAIALWVFNNTGDIPSARRENR